MKRNFLQIFLFLLFITSVNILFGQDKNSIGVDFTGEIISNKNFIPGIGIFYNRVIKNHHSIGIGCYYRTYNEELFFFPFFSNKKYYFTVQERYLSIPIIYKYSLKLINISAGMGLDMYMGWKEVDNQYDNNIKMDKYAYDKSYYKYIIIKVGKDIKLTDNFYIEPALRYSNILDSERYYIGIGINCKYNF